MRKNLVLTILVSLALLTIPALAEEEFATIDKVPSGFDVWQTVGSGATGYGFGDDPLPKDFFCPGSEPFKDRISFEGVPVKTEPAGYLGLTDTIIERLDDAVFNEDGLAKTRIQIRALHLEGIDTIKNSCGEWTVKAGLAEEQPVSDMIFNREYSIGGTMHADLWVDVRLVFTHVKTGETREVTRLINLPSAKATPFACSSTCPKPIGVLPVTLGNSAAGKLSVGSISPVIIDIRPTCTTGCICNPERPSQCLPVLPYHEDCNPPPTDPVALALCEQHFTVPPCEIYEVECDDKSLAARLVQLQDLHRKGIINEAPEKALEKQISRER